MLATDVLGSSLWISAGLAVFCVIWGWSRPVSLIFYGFVWLAAGLGWYRLVLLRCVLLKLALGCFFCGWSRCVWVVLGRSQLVYVRFGEFCVVLGWSLLVLAGPAAFCVVLRCCTTLS